MSFKSLLNLNCDIISESTEEIFDDYGNPLNPVTSTISTKFRIDLEVNQYIQNGKTVDCKQLISFFLPNIDIKIDDTVISEVGKEYKVTDVDQVYGRRRVHHLEVTLERCDIGY